jgi:tetratricopeptide (TPR) repeat protein
MMSSRGLALAVLLASSTALAQPKSPPTDAQKQAAGNLAKQAIAKSQAGDHEAAIKLYLEAYQIVPEPLLLTNIASEFKQLKKSVDALRYFCMYLKEAPTGSNASYALSEATILHMDLAIQGDVCKPEQTTVTEPPPTKTDPPPPPKLQPASGGGGMRMIGLGTAGVGVLALGAGVFFGVKARENSDLISNHNMAEEWPANIKQIEADGQAYENRQILFTIVGGALVATGVVVYVIGRSKKTETSMTVAPTATTDSAGVSLSGRF